MFRRVLVLSVSALYLSSCASDPQDVAAQQVSTLPYKSLDCDQLADEFTRINSRVAQVTEDQQDAATRDAAVTGVGLILFWPALFALAAGDHSDELGRLKGEAIALETVAVEKECSFAPEIKAAQELREIEAENQLPPEERAAAQEARFQAFEARLKASKTELTALLNRYNNEAEFETSGHQTGQRLNIKDVSRVTVVDWRREGYVVRIVGNSGLSASWSYEVYDEHFLIQDRDGLLTIMGHGSELAAQQLSALD